MNTPSTQHCRCWPLVLGTLLITMGVLNLGFGVSSTVAAIELSNLAQAVNSDHTAIAVGRVFRKISAGTLSIGDMGMGAEAQHLLKQLPNMIWALLLGVLRVGLAVLSMALGAALCRRHQPALTWVRLWSLVAIGFGGLSVWTVGVPMSRVLSEMDGIAGWLMMGIDVTMHILWPIVVFVVVRRAIEQNEILAC